MERKEVFKKVVDILKDEFEDDELEVTNETTAADVEEWDSLVHLSIIYEIECTFNIKHYFTTFKNSTLVAESAFLGY